MATAQIIQHLKPGGIESLALTLLDQLNKNTNDAFKTNNNKTNNKNIIISLEGNKKKTIKAWPRLEPYIDQLFFLNKPEKFSLATILKLKSILKSHHIAAIHTHHIGPFIYGGLAGAAAGIKTHIHTEHDGWHLHNAKHSGIQRCLNYFLQPTLVSDAEKVAQQVLKHTGFNSQVIYNGVDIQRFKPAESDAHKNTIRREWGLNHDCVLVGAAGRLETVKGHEYLLKAMALLPNMFHLAIAGEGSLATQLRILASSLNINERVHFLGQTDQTHKFYPMLDIFCLPSLNEGFPLAPLEAQACNIPTIVTDVGGATETLCPNSGLAVQAGDEYALASAIIKHHINQNSCQQKILTHSNTTNTPRDYICQHFSIEAMACAYQKLLCA